MGALYDPASLGDVRAMLAAVPDGVIAPDSLTFTRLHDDGGALHTGGEGGIVYAACAVASVVNCPEEHDPAMRLIARVPAALAGMVEALDKACQYAVRKRDERDRLRDAIKAHRAATLTGLLGKAEQDAADRALWQAAGLE